MTEIKLGKEAETNSETKKKKNSVLTTEGVLASQEIERLDNAIKARKYSALVEAEKQDTDDIENEENEEWDDYEAEESHSLIKFFQENGDFKDWEKDKDGILHHPELSSIHLDQVGNIFGSYKELRKYATEENLSGQRKDTDVTWEVHHLIHQDVLSRLGMSTNLGPSVFLTSEDHKALNGLEVPFGFQTIDELKADYARIYEDQPQWVQETLNYIDQNKDSIEAGLIRLKDTSEESTQEDDTTQHETDTE